MLALAANGKVFTSSISIHVGATWLVQLQEPDVPQLCSNPHSRQALPADSPSILLWVTPNPLLDQANASNTVIRNPSSSTQAVIGLSESTSSAVRKLARQLKGPRRGYFSFLWRAYKHNHPL